MVPLNVIQSILHRFPKHHLYFINPDFNLINEMHRNTLKAVKVLGPLQYDLLIRLCYFDDTRRSEQCEKLFQYKENKLQLAGEHNSEDDKKLLKDLHKFVI